MKINSIIASTCMCVVALAGCVTVESTRAKLESNDPSQIKAAEANIYEKAVDRELNDGNPAEDERVEYVRLTSNQELLLRIVDYARNKKVRVAAAEQLDFSKKGVAYSFATDVYRNDVLGDAILFGKSKDTAESLRSRIVANLTEDEMSEIIVNSISKHGRTTKHGAPNYYTRIDPNRKEKNRKSFGLDGKLIGLCIVRLAKESDSLEILGKIIRAGSRGIPSDVVLCAAQRFAYVLDKKSELSSDDVSLTREILMKRGHNGWLEIHDRDVRFCLMKKLPDDVLAEVVESMMKECLDHDVPIVCETAIKALANVKDEKAIVAILTAALGRHKGTVMPESLAGIKLSDEVVSQVISNVNVPWRSIIGKVTPECAYSLLLSKTVSGVDKDSVLGAVQVTVSRVHKDSALEVAVVKKVSPSKITVDLYDAVKSEAAKKALMARMPAEVKEVVLGKRDSEFAAVVEKAKAASETVFELQGFYLGMNFADMKIVLAHHFPDYTIREDSDGGDLVVYVPKQSDPFCYASKDDEKVYRFNFGKAILKKWYRYDVQTFREWAASYARETGADMRYVMIKDDVTNLYDQSSTVWFHQESYQYKSNAKEYRVIYFGEESATNSHMATGLEGMLIEDAARKAMRKTLGEPGTLRVQVDRD